MTDTGIAGGLRETLAEALRAEENEPAYDHALMILRGAITTALTQLEALEAGHEAMEKLRKTSKSTHTWQFMGGLLLQVDKQNIRRIKPGYVDPARAILGPGDSNG